MLSTAAWPIMIPRAKKGGRNYTFCQILPKNRGRNTTFSSFSLKYRGRNYTNFPETWKSGSKWWSICSNLHIMSTLPGDIGLAHCGICEMGLLSVSHMKIQHPWMKSTAVRDSNGLQWVSHQICEIAGCACTGNAGNVFPTTTGQRSRYASRHVRNARAVMHVGIAN